MAFYLHSPFAEPDAIIGEGGGLGCNILKIWKWFCRQGGELPEFPCHFSAIAKITQIGDRCKAVLDEEEVEVEEEDGECFGSGNGK